MERIGKLDNCSLVYLKKNKYLYINFRSRERSIFFIIILQMNVRGA